MHLMTVSTLFYSDLKYINVSWVGMMFGHLVQHHLVCLLHYPYKSSILVTKNKADLLKKKKK